MFNVLLFEPEIPPNTGNIIRLCANTGTHLHLIRPLGFEWSDRRLKRAGLDYHEWARVSIHDNLTDYLRGKPLDRVFAFTTKGESAHHAVRYLAADTLMFGPESRGLPVQVLNMLPPAQRLRIPMQPASRSLNLSNAVAVAVYEAWRQHDFANN